MGPLTGFRFVEMAGIGPTQLTGMLLADMGADIIRVGRQESVDLGVGMPERFNLMNRSRSTVPIAIKDPLGIDLVLKLCERADGLFEGFRPGVMERLGLSPEACWSRNPRLVFGRMTGWGQEGPLANAAGHDGNYVAITGVLDSIGEKGRGPAYPLNLVGDFGGGSLYLAMGILAALLETSRSGQGQVVDATIVDGAASLMTLFHGLLAGGMWREERGTNLLDGSAPYVRTYRTKDDRYVMVSPIEQRFYKELLERLGIDDIDPKDQLDAKTWPALEERLTALFATKTQNEWTEILEGTDACFGPVLSLSEAPKHPHNVARGVYQDIDGIVQPGPAPRFSRTNSEVRHGPQDPGTNSAETLERWGFAADEVEELIGTGIVSGSG